MGGSGRSAAVWDRAKIIVSAPADHSWWKSHAQTPTILPLEDGLWRVYFGARDARPVSHIMCVDLDPLDQLSIVRMYDDPVLEPGPAGSFDCHGVVPACAVEVNGRINLYYTGVVRREDVPYATSIGVAVSDDGLHFKRQAGPAMAIGARDPFFTSAPFVTPRQSGFEMWYVSGLGWSYREGEAREEPIYNIRRTTSADGLMWDPASEQVLGDAGAPAEVVTRPWLLSEGTQRTLWYCRRSAHGFRSGGQAAYRIWQADFVEGSGRIPSGSPITYRRPPRLGDWDAEMQAYPCIAPTADGLIMLYNGNNFGGTGFGWARAVRCVGS